MIPRDGNASYAHSGHLPGLDGDGDVPACAQTLKARELPSSMPARPCDAEQNSASGASRRGAAPQVAAKPAEGGFC